MSTYERPGQKTDDTWVRGAGHTHGGHGWMMIICCIPMLLIAAGLVVTGAASPSFLFVALACTAMMALMMRAMTPRDEQTDPGHVNAEPGPPRER